MAAYKSSPPLEMQILRKVPSAPTRVHARARARLYLELLER